MAVLGFVLVALYKLLVSEAKLAKARVDDRATGEPVRTPITPDLPL
jgi:hypothetical protein